MPPTTALDAAWEPDSASFQRSPARYAVGSGAVPPHAFEPQAGRRDVAGDTHWDRILHCDVMARSTVDPALRVAGPPPREASGSGQMRSPLTQAAILLCIYVGMYLAVGVVIDAVSWFTADHVPAASATSASVAPLPIEASK